MIWFIHRNDGPGTSISWAGQYEQPGYADEQLDDATSTELQAFLDPPLSPLDMLAQKLAAGLAITSTGTPALNAIYALDDTSQAQLFQIGSFVKNFAIFPSGTATQPYPDVTGTPHVFNATQFINLLLAAAAYVSAAQTAAATLAAGGQAQWPAAIATIA